MGKELDIQTVESEPENRAREQRGKRKMR